MGGLGFQAKSERVRGVSEHKAEMSPSLNPPLTVEAHVLSPRQKAIPTVFARRPQ